MDEKELEITFSDGSKWVIPARFIARKRAEYYALHDVGGELNADNEEEYERIVAEEIEHALRDGFEITDWANNNMNWSDVEREAVRIREPNPVNMETEWSNAAKHVKDLPK